jgi:hypothetical protein
LSLAACLCPRGFGVPYDPARFGEGLPHRALERINGVVNGLDLQPTTIFFEV